MGQRRLLGLLLASPLVAQEKNENSYIKYPRYDGYVRSCSQKEENFGFEEELEVRRYIPNIRSREWSSRPETYSQSDGVQSTTTRMETRYYHTGDERSIGQIGDPTANVKDTFTLTQGSATGPYEYPHTSGPYETNLDEGTLNPFDSSALSGWCGEDEAGDRVTFLMFDLSDFDDAAVQHAVLRMTPKHFPWKATVQVRGACDPFASQASTKQNAHANGPVGGLQGGSSVWESSDGTGQQYGGASSAFGAQGASKGGLWHEGTLTWTSAPFIRDDEAGKVVCTWSGGPAEELYPANEPYECNVTQLVKEHAEGHLCLTVDMEHLPGNTREPVVFWSKDFRGEGTQGGRVGGGDRLGGEHSSSLQSSEFPHPGDAYAPYGPGRDLGTAKRHRTFESGVGGGVRGQEQMFESGDVVRQNARTLPIDANMGGAFPASATASGASGAGASGAGGTKGLGGPRVPSPGLEYGTVRRLSSPGKGAGKGKRGAWGATHDNGASWRPHLVIEGSNCGRFPDHAALDADCR